jgi:DNA-binding NarL/FixJ family response regulator
MTIRLLLADDHRLMRDGLRFLFSEQPDIEVVGEAADGRAALAQVSELLPSVVLIGLALPELNGIDATRHIRTRHPEVKVIGLSPHADRRHLHQMLAAGAWGYVLKYSSCDELLRAVRAAGNGESNATTLEDRGGAQGLAKQRTANTLSGREREVLQLVTEGFTSAEIALRLSLSIKTVETHRRNIVRKLELHSTAQLTKYAIREGLTSVDR